MIPEIQFPRFFSTDSTKAIKANEWGYLNAINYMAPHKLGGVGNLCSHASPACMALCLGWYSGQADMVSAKTKTNAVRDSRRRKAEYFMRNREAYLCEMIIHIAAAIRTANRKGLFLTVRPNGATDIAYEGLRVFVGFDLQRKVQKICGLEIPVGLHTIFSAFPQIQFVDYTKNPKRFERNLPPNYYLTFSRSETNDADCVRLLSQGINVAIVFGDAEQPTEWNGFAVIDGDTHDLRQLDPSGVVVGLSPKGRLAKADRTGFVLRSAA